MFLRQERVQVITGYAAWDVWIAVANLVRISIAQAPQLSVDARLPVAVAFYRFVLVVGRLATPESRAVVEQNLETGDIIDHFARALRCRTAGVVADHPTERAVGMRRWLWSVAQPMHCQLLIERIQNDPGLDDAGAGLRIDRDDTMAVLGPVEDHCGIRTLPG